MIRNNKEAIKEWRAHDLSQLIRGRRSIYPPSFLDKPIPKNILEEILLNGCYAPNYKKTEPWRFKVFYGESTKEVGAFISETYKKITPVENFKEKKYLKIIEKGERSAAIIAICMQRDPLERLKEWEEIAAVAMAVQNMWLTATKYQIGAYWSSHKAIYAAKNFLGLKEGERCLGFFFMGYVDAAIQPANRKPLSEVVEWRE